MIIREVAAADLGACYEICLRTGDSGADATGKYDDPRLLGHVYAAPYVTMPEGLGFVAEHQGEVAGYVLGTADTVAYEAACEALWWPELRQRHPDPGLAPSTPDERLAAMIHRPPTATADVVADYPAHLHIDLLTSLQGTGAGRALMEHMYDALASAGAGGVHLGVGRTNDRAIGFYRHLGFQTLQDNEHALVLGRRL